MRNKLLYLILCATLLSACHSMSRAWIVGGQHKQFVQNNPIAAVVLTQPTQTSLGGLDANGQTPRYVTFVAQAHDVANRENSYTFIAICTLEITADCMGLSPTSTLDIRQWRVLAPIGDPSVASPGQAITFPRPCDDHLHHGDLHGCTDTKFAVETFVTIEVSRIKDLKH